MHDILSSISAETDILGSLVSYSNSLAGGKYKKESNNPKTTRKDLSMYEDNAVCLSYQNATIAWEIGFDVLDDVLLLEGKLSLLSEIEAMQEQVFSSFLTQKTFAVCNRSCHSYRVQSIKG